MPIKQLEWAVVLMSMMIVLVIVLVDVMVAVMVRLVVMQALRQLAARLLPVVVFSIQQRVVARRLVERPIHQRAVEVVTQALMVQS